MVARAVEIMLGLHEQTDCVRRILHEFKFVLDEAEKEKCEVRKCMQKVPAQERDLVRNELVQIADRLMKQYDLTIHEVRALLREILSTAI
jgi:hypothetical protein